MDTTKIIKAARAEYAAEQNKTKSDAAWRSRWWETTLLLAETNGQNEAAAANAAVQEELDCSLTYLNQRRRAGKIIKSIREHRDVDLAEIRGLPPRLALAWVNDLKRGEDGMIEALHTATSEEHSLREFIAAHGGVPMSTSRERFTPTPPAPAPRTREEKVAAAREALADPEVAQEVMRDVPTSINAAKASQRAAVEEHEARQRDEAIQNPPAAERKRKDREEMGRVMDRVNLDQALRDAKRSGIAALGFFGQIRGSLSPLDRELLLNAISESIAPLEALRDGVSNNRSMDAELAALLAEGE